MPQGIAGLFDLVEEQKADPPFVGTAVNVIVVPAHIEVADAVMLTAGVIIGLTVIEIILLVTLAADAQV